MEKWKVVVVMPAYNAEKTLEKTYKEIPKDVVDEVLVVDDGSNDKTVMVAKKLGIRIVVHPKNLGYGGNQKTCYKEALKIGADIVVMIHPDYQYDPKLTKYLTEPIKEGLFDIMLGSRIRTRKEALEGGMPLWKYISNRFLTLVENLALGLSLSEYHTGFRAYSKKVLQDIDFEKFSNDFVFDQEILIAAVSKGFRIGEIAVPVRYFPESSSINFVRSVRYGISTLISVLKYLIGHKAIGFFVFIIILFVYVIFTRREADGSFLVHPSDYFSHLAQSFTKGRLDLVDPGETHDLTSFNNKWYMYWGPTPVMLILPFVLLFGLSFSDCLYTAIIGSFASLVVYFIFGETNKIGFTALDIKRRALLTFFFGLGTVYFVNSTMGGVWFTSQVVSTLYILISLFFAFRFRNTFELKSLILSSIFLGMAIFGRATFVFYVPFIFAIIFFAKRKLKNLLLFFLILAIFYLLNGFYNYGRFGSFFENGYKYMNMARLYRDSMKEIGVVSPVYIKNNFYYTFMHLPKISSTFPFFNFDAMGNSMIFLSPLFLLMPLILRRKYWAVKEFAILNLINIVCLTALIVSLLMFFGTGYMQFGARYMLDAVPFIIILLAEISSEVNSFLLLILTTVSVYFNAVGRCVFVKC